jgi:acyl-CoA thioester hydrolase
MINSQVRIRVRYAETDKMGYVYYGHYASYFEVARVEALRELGATYRSMEDQGIMLPVYTFSIKYLKPAFYDDELTIKTTIPHLPSTRIEFGYETYNHNNELLNTAQTTLVFINSHTGRPMPAPAWFLEKLYPFFI